MLEIEGFHRMPIIKVAIIFCVFEETTAEHNSKQIKLTGSYNR